MCNFRIMKSIAKRTFDNFEIFPLFTKYILSYFPPILKPLLEILH